MDEPKPDSHKQQSENSYRASGNEGPGESLIQNVGSSPNAETACEPQENANGQANPSHQAKITEAVALWLYRYWNAPREKSKWTDICTVMLTLGIAMAAFWSAWIFQGQLTETRRQTRQSLESFRIDERAWIEIQPIMLPSNAAVRLGAFRYELYPKNIGKTAAINIKIRALRGSTLSSITMGDSAPQIGMLQDKMLLPGGALSDVPRVNPPSNVLAPNTVATVPFIMDGQAPQIFPKDEWVSYLIGRIDYNDAFNTPHWVKFCFFVVDAKGNLWNCKEGNDEDRNPEIPPEK